MLPASFPPRDRSGPDGLCQLGGYTGTAIPAAAPELRQRQSYGAVVLVMALVWDHETKAQKVRQNKKIILNGKLN